MNEQKTNEKISLSNDTLNNVMLVSVNGPDIAEFDAAPPPPPPVLSTNGFRLENAEIK